MMDLKEIGNSVRNWVDSAQDRDYWRALVHAALNLRVSQTMELCDALNKCAVCCRLLKTHCEMLAALL